MQVKDRKVRVQISFMVQGRIITSKEGNSGEIVSYVVSLVMLLSIAAKKALLEISLQTKQRKTNLKPTLLKM